MHSCKSFTIFEFFPDHNKGSGTSGTGTSKCDEGIGSKSISTSNNDNTSGGDDSSTKAENEVEVPMELDDHQTSIWPKKEDQEKK